MALPNVHFFMFVQQHETEINLTWKNLQVTMMLRYKYIARKKARKLTRALN